jgi:hypothetical protein
MTDDAGSAQQATATGAPTISSLNVPNPFGCQDDVSVGVSKPDTTSDAEVTLAVSLPPASISPAKVTIPAMMTTDTAIFTVTYNPGTSGNGVTFTATVKQSGHSPNSSNKTANVNCSM